MTRESGGLTGAVRIVTRVARHVQVSAGNAYGLGYRMLGCPRYRRPMLACRVGGRYAECVRAQARGYGWRMVALKILPNYVHPFVKAHQCDSPSSIADPFTGLHLAAADRYPHLWSRLPAWWSRSCFAATGVVGRRLRAGIPMRSTSGRGGRNARGETRF